MNDSIEQAAQWFRLHVKRVGVLMLVVACLAGTGLGQGRRGNTPDLGICSILQVPAGNSLFFRVYAEGVQIYRWDGTSWAFVAPEATLSANRGGTGVVGTHYAGPTWESVSGSKVVGVVELRCTPDPNDIPWLRLRAASTEHPGIFQNVTYILRLNTSGGNAPATPGGTIGQIAQVPYTTEYYFYRQHP